MFWVMTIPSVTFFFSLLFIPESPRFLVASGKKEKALAVLTRSHGRSGRAGQAGRDRRLLGRRSPPPQADRHPRFEAALPPHRVGRHRAGQLPAARGYQRRLLLRRGVVAVAGFKESDALLINVISGGVSILACFFATASSIGWGASHSAHRLDRHGRHPGRAGRGFRHRTHRQRHPRAHGQRGPHRARGANLYVMLFNFSWGPVMWVMLGEMFPNQIRGSGLAISGLAQWLSNFGITMTFPMLLAGVGLGGAYGLYTFAPSSRSSSSSSSFTRPRAKSSRK
jgi:SP family sugar:H+ symporter-like MFS transporter